MLTLFQNYSFGIKHSKQQKQTFRPNMWECLLLLLFLGDTSLFYHIIVMNHCNDGATHLSFYCNVRTTLNITLKVTSSNISKTGKLNPSYLCQRSYYIQNVTPSMQNIIYFMEG